MIKNLKYEVPGIVCKYSNQRIALEVIKDMLKQLIDYKCINSNQMEAIKEIARLNISDSGENSHNEELEDIIKYADKYLQYAMEGKWEVFDVEKECLKLVNHAISNDKNMDNRIQEQTEDSGERGGGESRNNQEIDLTEKLKDFGSMLGL